MKYVYVDESGDFGFSETSTKTVIIAATFTSEPKDLSVWFKRIKRRKLELKVKRLNEIKASQVSDDFRNYFYQRASLDLNFSVYAVIIDKNKIPLKLKDEEGIIYLKSIERLVELTKMEIDEVMFWYFDRRPLKKVIWENAAQTIRGKLILMSRDTKPLIEVHPFESHRNLNLQFADFIAYALYQAAEHSNNQWLDQIRSHIKKIETVKF